MSASGSGRRCLPSDFDEDGDVDGDDFLIWQSSFGNDDGGDADDDGDTDGDDFLIWQTQFGTANGNASSAMPEPTTAMLFAIGYATIGIPFVIAASSRTSNITSWRNDLMKMVALDDGYLNRNDG